MEIVSIGALIEIKAEENEERAFDALKAAVAELASTMKDLRRATDRFGARMSTAVSKTEQIRSACTALSSSMVELRNSLHSLEQTTNMLVNSSLPVAPSTMASHHRHVPLPLIPSITGSIPPSSSTSPPYSSSTVANSSVNSNLPSVVVPTTEVLRASITEPLPTLTRTDKPPSLEFPDSQFEEPPTTTFQRTFTEISPSLYRVEKQFIEPPWLPNLAPFFSPSIEFSDFPIAKPQTVTNRSNYLTSLKKLNSTDLDWEDEGGQILIPEIVHHPFPVLDDEQLLPSTVGISNTRHLRDITNSLGCQSNQEDLPGQLAIRPKSQRRHLVPLMQIFTPFHFKNERSRSGIEGHGPPIGGSCSGGSVDAKFGRTKNLQPSFVARWPLTLVAEHYRLSGWGYQCVPVVCNSDMDDYEVWRFSLITSQCSPAPMALNRRHGDNEQFHFNQPFGNTTCLSIAEKLQESVEMVYTQLPPNHKVLLKSVNPPASKPSAVKYYNQTRGCQSGRENSGQNYICFPHAHWSDFQGISSHGQVSGSCTFSHDSTAKLQDACPIPRRVDVMKLTIENGPNFVQLVSYVNSSCDLSLGFEMTIRIPSVRTGITLQIKEEIMLWESINGVAISISFSSWL